MTNQYQRVEREAVARARSNHRAETPGIYVQESRARVTTERAVAEALENDPSVYEEYREMHNASPLLNTLARAGVKLQRS